MIEILTIQLKPGTRDQFHELYLSASVPLQQKWRIDVVAHGPAENDPDVYYVVRRFKNLADRQQSEDAFYNSDDWQKGPRTTILALIHSIATLVVDLETFKQWTDSIKP